MSIISSDNAILSVGEGASSVTLAGLRRHSLVLSRVLTETTTTEDEGWLAVSPRQGPASAEIRGEGIFLTNDASGMLRAAFLSGAADQFAMFLPGDGTWSAIFYIRSLTYAGRSEDEESFSIRLMSTGPIAFTPVT